MPTERALLDEINRSLDVLTERVDGLRTDMAESRADSRENRERVYQRLEESEAKSEEAAALVLDRLAKLEATTAATAARVAKIEPTIEAFTRLQQRGIGATAIIGLAATLIGGAIALKWDAFAAWIHSWWQSP